MIPRSTRFAALLGALLAGACQTYDTRPMSLPGTTPMDGIWASTDGVFVASFDRGSFTSRFTATNEVLAQGTYSVAGSMVTMQWISVATQQRRSASCSINSADNVTCNQDGGGHFELRRTTAASAQEAIRPSPPPPATVAPPLAPAPPPAPAPAPPLVPAPPPAPAQ